MGNSKIYVIGHKNPDTDSICSAIAYAYLRKTVTGKNYTPARAGQVSPETAFVLERFKVEVPRFMDDVRTQIKDVYLQRIQGNRICPFEKFGISWKRKEYPH